MIFEKKLMVYKNVLDLFDENAQKYPNFAAISEGEIKYTYASLALGANRLAQYLIHHGKNEPELCFVFTNGTMEIVQSLLGVFKSGKIFVPIGKDLPNPELIELIKFYKPAWIISDEVNGNRISDLIDSQFSQLGIRHCAYDAGFDETLPTGLSQKRELAAAKIMNEDHPAYIFFTSGSTGRPKGILGAFKGIDHFISWELDYLKLPAHPQVAQLSFHTFDAFLRDVFVPLSMAGTICVPPKNDGLIAFNLLIDWIKTEKIDLIHCVPTMLRHLMKKLTPDSDFPDLKFILLSGESLFGEDIEKWTTFLADKVQLINLYGPSETTMTKFFYPINLHQDLSGPIPIGKPMSGCKAILLDKALMPILKGQIGEIYIKTPFPLLGYYKDEQLTKEVFIKHPLEKGNHLLYKTGDLAYLTDDGNYHFCGRTDHQIKINGIRIDLNDIESRIRQLSYIHDVMVLYPGKSLIACIILKEEAVAIDPSNILTDLMGYMPRYMVPSQLRLRKVFPLNSNGKSDRKKITAEIEADLKQLVKKIELPENKIQKDLETIWLDVIKPITARISINSNFFELGGHSLDAIIIINRINKKFKQDFALNDIFLHPTIKSMAARIRNLKEQNETNEESDGLIHNVQSLNTHWLTFKKSLPQPSDQNKLEVFDTFNCQQKEYLGFLIRGFNGFNLTFVLPFQDLNVAAIKETIDLLVFRHESLRTTFKEDGDKLYQCIHPGKIAGSDIQFFDFSADRAIIKNTTVLYNLTIRTRFDFENGPLFIVKVVKMRKNVSQLSFTINHVISDESSLEVLKAELKTIYETLIAGGIPQLKPLEIQYKDYALWRNSLLESPIGLAAKDYYNTQIAKSIALNNHNTTLERRKNKIVSYEKTLLKELLKFGSEKEKYFKYVHGTLPLLKVPKGKAYTVFIAGELFLKLKKIAVDLESSLFMTLISSFALLFYQLRKEENIRIYLPFSTRMFEEFEQLVGWLTSEIILCIEVNPNISFSEFNRKVTELILNTSKYSFYPHENIMKDLDITINQMSPVMLNFIKATDTEIVSLLPFHGNNGTGHFDFRATILEHKNGISIRAQYNTAVFNAAEIEEMFQTFLATLDQVTGNPEVKISNFANDNKVLSPVEEHLSDFKSY